MSGLSEKEHPSAVLLPYPRFLLFYPMGMKGNLFKSNSGFFRGEVRRRKEAEGGETLTAADRWPFFFFLHEGSRLQPYSCS